MHNDIDRILISEEEAAEIVKRLGKCISLDYYGKKLLLIGILKGSAVFMADLMRHIELPCTIDFMSITSYGDSTEQSGRPRILLDLSKPIDGLDVLIVEDILDSGVTLSYVRELLLQRNAASVKICTFMDKPERRQRPIFADYIGKTVENEFVVGYGLDYAQRYRNLPYVGILKREVYSK